MYVSAPNGQTERVACVQRQRAASTVACAPSADGRRSGAATITTVRFPRRVEASISFLDVQSQTFLWSLPMVSGVLMGILITDELSLLGSAFLGGIFYPVTTYDEYHDSHCTMAHGQMQPEPHPVLSTSTISTRITKPAASARRPPPPRGGHTHLVGRRPDCSFFVGRAIIRMRSSSLSSSTIRRQGSHLS